MTPLYRNGRMPALRFVEGSLEEEELEEVPEDEEEEEAEEEFEEEEPLRSLVVVVVVVVVVVWLFRLVVRFRVRQFDRVPLVCFQLLHVATPSIVFGLQSLVLRLKACDSRPPLPCG